MKTAMQKFLEQIVLKQVEGSVYLLPTITDIQINELLEAEKEQMINFHIEVMKQGLDYLPKMRETAEQYYQKTYNPEQ